MTVNNFTQILGIIRFESPDDFYFVQILQRKKDGNECKDSGNNHYRLIKSYYIYSEAEFFRRMPRIIELCKANNARAYFNLNKRSYEMCCVETAKQMLTLQQEGQCQRGPKVWDSVCGKTQSKTSNKFWVVDVDSKDEQVVQGVIDAVNKCRSGNDLDLFGSYHNVKYIIPTVNGMHLITNGFNLMELHVPVDVKKNSPTILYYYDPNDNNSKE